jgi:hypothetical protein
MAAKSLATGLFMLSCLFAVTGALAQEARTLPRPTGYVRTPAHLIPPSPPQARAKGPLPPKVDWIEPRMPVAGHQGEQGSCASWSVVAARAAYAPIAAEPAIRHWDLAPSPAFLFNVQEHPKPCTGSSIGANLERLRTIGAPPGAVFPYEKQLNGCTRQPDARLNDAAAPFRISAAESIGKHTDDQRSWPGKLDDIKLALLQGHPVIIGARYVPPSPWRARQGHDILTPGDNELSRGKDDGHAMVIIGYDEARQAFRVQNSWGTEWGDQGRAWISYEALADTLFEAWRLSIAKSAPVEPDPQPVPEPPPTPPPLDVDDIRAKMAEVIGRNRCGWLDARFDDGVITLSGLADPHELNEYIGQLRKIAGVSGVERTQVSDAPFPRCELLATLRKSLDRDNGLSVGEAGMTRQFTRGEAYTFPLTTGSRPAFLHMLHFASHGEATLIAWPLSDQPTQPGQDLRFPDRSLSPIRIVVGNSPPYGEETVVLIASDTPLLRPGVEWPAREAVEGITGARPRQLEYREALTLLSRAINTAPKANVSASWASVFSLP